MNTFSKSEKIYLILKQMILTGSLANEIKLPPVRELSGQLGTSRNTVIQVMNRLEKEKCVVRKHRSGIYNANAKVDDSQFNAKLMKHKRKYECVADQIETDIQQGKFKTGTILPSNKVLAFQYRVSGVILRLALAQASNKGLIHRYAGHWIAGGKVEQSPIPKTRKYIYIIGLLPPWRRQFDDTFLNLFIRSLEVEFQNYGITIKEYLDPEKYKSWIQLAHEPSTAGFVLIGSLWFGDVSNLRTFREILLLFRNISCPLVINDFNFPLFHQASFRSFPISLNIFPLWYNDQKGPETVANYLALHGHKKVAFLTYRQEHKNRLSIIENKLKQLAGEKTECYFIFFKLELDFLPLSIKQMPSYVRKAIPAIFSGHKFKIIDPIESLYLRLGRSVDEDLCWQRISPLLENLLKNEEICAWVCDETLVALTTVDFLEKKGIRIPEQLSVFALYGDERCLDKSITAFECGHDIAGYLSAHCILGDIPIKKVRKGLVEIEGKLMVRNSVGPAPKEEKR